MTLGLILGLCFFSTAVLVYYIIPQFTDKAVALNQQRVARFEDRMNRVLMRNDIQKASQLYLWMPLVLALASFFLVDAPFRLIAVVAGIIGGLLFPPIYVKFLIKQRRKKFYDQLIDGLMIMSSSFRGGLSLFQAFEAVVEEMPEPINQEIGILLSENKMGVSLEEALNHLYNRMPSPALQQTITAILLARETGGNLPAIFTRIVNTIRERKKIQDNIDTLTLQGKIQGAVMTLLPFVFGFIVYTSNPQYLEAMTQTDIGRKLLVYAVISEIIGGIMIWKISSFKDY